jgi:hypothetical protein
MGISRWFSKLHRMNKAPATLSNPYMKSIGGYLMKTTSVIGWIALVTLASFAVRAQTPSAPTAGVAAQPQVDIPANMSPGAAEVVRLATSGVGDEVVLAYIQNSQAPFNLTADHVVYLKDLGLSPQVSSAMLNHDSALRGQPQQYAPAPAAPATPAPTTPPPIETAAPPAAAAAQAPAYVTSPPEDVTYFYNDLSPYGTWVFLEGYGWCWQPRTVVIAPGWRPYVDGGYWVYSDAGWFWSSSYTWGWAPFHYGRWYQHPHNGWVWFPDRVWGPAWVTWRTAGTTCGWAPLPPHAVFDAHLGWRYNGVAVGASFGFGLGAGAYAFVSFGDVCNHNLRPHCLPPAQVNTVYKQTTIINNYTVNNTTIVNHGVPVERISAASRTPVPRATIRNLPAGARPAAAQSTSVVYRREPPPPSRSANMVAEKVDARHPTIQHTRVAPTRSEQPAFNRNNPIAPATSPQRSAAQPPRTTLSAQPNSQAVAPAPTAPAATSSARQSPSVERNPHVYYPKGYYQNSELRATPRPEQQRPAAGSSWSDNADSHSRKNH